MLAVRRNKPSAGFSTLRTRLTELSVGRWLEMLPDDF